MGYDGSTPIRGSGIALPAEIDAWFGAHGEAPTGLGAAVAEESRALGINADVVAAQIAHETGFWTSEIARAKNNPAGLGAVNTDPVGGALAFPSVRAGVHAQVAHLGTYVLGASNPWREDDPRYAAVEAAGTLGVVRVLDDLDGRWVWPGQGYGAALARLANDLVGFVQVEREARMLVDDQAAIWLESSNLDRGRGSVAIDRIILHTTEGAYDGAVAWLRGATGGTANRGSSAHYVVAADGGRVAQLVREADTAWAAGNYAWNQRSVSIEQEGFAARGGFSDGLYATVGALVGRVAARHSIPLDREHVIGHAEVPDQDHTDPGPLYDFARVLAIARSEQAGGDRSLDPNARYFPPPIDKWVVNRPDAPVLGFWEQGGVERYGYPLTGLMLDSDGVYRQLFENCLLESYPKGFGHYPGPHVRMGGLGQRYLALQQLAALSAKKA